jgi:23S rRNA pseudouridine2605 synthase
MTGHRLPIKMAQQRNNKSKSKGTSFGKKSGAEKAFRGKKKSRPDDSFDGGKRSASGASSFSRPFRKPGGAEGRPDGFSKSRPESGVGDFKKPFQKREGGSFRKTGSSASFGKPGGFRKSDGDFKFKKREEGSSDSDKPRFSKPFRSEGGDERPFRKTGSPSFGKPGGFRKSDSNFKKRFDKESGSDSDKPRFSKPFRPEGGGEKPFRKTSSSPSFGKQGFGKSEGDFKRPFKRSDEGSSDSASDKPRFSKPFHSEGGDEKPFRKTGNSSNSFGRPVKFEKPEGSKKYSDDFKKPPKKSALPEGREDSTGEERPKRGEGKPYNEGEKRPFVQKRVIRSAKSFKPKVWEEKPSDGLTRLNKYIANSGVCSRREADNLITMGLISVNRVTITELGYKVKQGDQVRYEDKLLKAEKPVYILLNKPKGFITTTDDPQERNTVMNLVASACKERIYPVGRLDRNTTGLLLLTNDGDLAEKLMHPSYKAKKIYKVELDKPLTKNDFLKIQEGVHLPEGKAIVDDLQMISDDSLTVGIEIHIGWNRVVRRIFESLGYTVVRLDRSVYAGLDKKEIGRGEWRFLKPEEIVKLKHFKG